MCKNNFTNENEFDFSDYLDPIPPWIPYSESVCNPSGPSNLGDVIIIIID